MIQAIFIKEWLKIKWAVAALVAAALCCSMHLYLNLANTFKTTEPETMIWYQAVHIGDIFYDPYKYFPIVAGIVLASIQFIPEIRGKKLRLTLHLPANPLILILATMAMGSLLFLMVQTVWLTGIISIIKIFYPNSVAMDAFFTMLPWFFSGLTAYAGLACAFMEPEIKGRILFAILSLSFIYIPLQEKWYRSSDYLFPFLILICLSLAMLIPLIIERYKNGPVDFFQLRTKSAKFSFGLLLILIITAGSIFIPKFYSDLNHKNQKSVYIMYSPLLKEFVWQENYGDHRFKYNSQSNAVTDRKAYEASLPFIYWKNLEINNKLPVTVDDHNYSKKDIRYGRQSFSLRPDMLPGHRPLPKLFPLFHTKSGKAQIPFPEHLFYMDNKIHFFDGASNKESIRFGEIFERALADADFLFPSKFIAGKTTNLKPFDEGYFILDAMNHLFHLKFFNSTPVVKKVSLPDNIIPRYIKINENRQKNFYGMVIDTKNRLYMLTYDNYKLVRLDLPEYNPDKMKLQLMVNPIYITARYSDSEKTYAKVFNKKLKPVSEICVKIPGSEALSARIVSWIFPFKIIFTRDTSLLTKPELIFGSINAWYLNFGLAFFYMIFMLKSGYNRHGRSMVTASAKKSKILTHNGSKTWSKVQPTTMITVCDEEFHLKRENFILPCLCLGFGGIYGIISLLCVKALKA